MPRDRYSRLFERAVFPLLDRLNGTRIAPKLEHLLAAEHLDPAEILQRQEAKLERTLDLARKGSALYRRHWARAGPAPASRYTLLDGLPVIRKRDLAGAGEATLEGFDGRVITCRTSGSTGSPMTFRRSVEQESWFWALRFRIWRWSGYRPGDPYLTVNLNPRLEWRKRLQDKLFRCAYLTFNADDQDSKRIVEHLATGRFAHLNGFSSSLYVLARYILDHGDGADGADFGVEGITATGDTLYPVYRQAVESAFGVRVLDYYGAGGEGVHLASQCRESGGRYHLHPENAITEILDERGPVAPGEPGRIVVTQLDNDAMPLIRYDLEDVAVAAGDDRPCACGRTLPMLERIEGRVPDLIAVPDGSFLVTHFFVVLFKNQQSIHRYQVVQDEPDRLRVRLVGRPGCDREAVAATVRREIAAATRDLLAIDVEWVDRIALSGAGKRRLVVSEVSRQLLGTATARNGAPTTS